MTVEYIRSFNQLLAAAPDCLGYQLSHCEEYAKLFIWRIEWTSVERHLNGFRKSAEFGAFLAVESFISIFRR